MFLERVAASPVLQQWWEREMGGGDVIERQPALGTPADWSAVPGRLPAYLQTFLLTALIARRPRDALWPGGAVRPRVHLGDASEHARAHEAEQEDEEAQHERRAERAEYLREKLDERAESEERVEDDA